ncbi:MAG: BON domain-containing protein [Planctomycetaceae bacterium]|nr:BON domain-containing protein [Planctomycetaceae bacterium]
MKFRVLLLFLIVCVPSSATLQAQLFGPNEHRKLSLADRRSSTGNSSLFGADLGIPSSRGTGAFVGADPTDQTGFIGVSESITPVPVVAATEGLQEEFIENVNEAVAIRTSAGIYSPRLTIAFEPIAPSRSTETRDGIERSLQGRAMSFQQSRDVTAPLLVDPAQRVQESLEKTLDTGSRAPIEVTVVNRTATLRGFVASASDRNRAELVASFEPGIDHVENQLTVEIPSNTSQE